MSKTLRITINLDEVFSIASLGITRAYCFAGTILNKENKLTIQSCHSHDGFKLDINHVPLESIQSEFIEWVKRNSLREVIELFEQSLISLFEALYKVQGGPSIEEYKKNIQLLNKKTTEFRHKDFPNKFDQIEKLLSPLDLSKERKFFQALQTIRNSISHNVGFAHKKKISVLLPSIEVKTTDLEGNTRYYFAGEAIDTYELRKDTSDPIDLEISYKEVEKTFTKDSYISFSDQELLTIIVKASIELQNLKSKIYNHFSQVTLTSTVHSK